MPKYGCFYGFEEKMHYCEYAIKHRLNLSILYFMTRSPGMAHRRRLALILPFLLETTSQRFFPGSFNATATLPLQTHALFSKKLFHKLVFISFHQG